MGIQAYSIKRILCIGCLGDNATCCEEYLDMISANNQLLYASGALSLFYQALTRAYAKQDPHSQQNTGTEISLVASVEIDLCFSLMYLLIESCRRIEALQEDLRMLTPKIVAFLFSVVSQLREKHVKASPFKKLILLLWKTILAAFGGIEKPKTLKNYAKILSGFYFEDKDIIAKCTPLDLYHFQNESITKFPGYTPPECPLFASGSLTMKATSALATAMGIASATASTELPYQALFPPKQSQTSNQTSTKKQQQANNLFSSHTPIVVPPLAGSQHSLPKSIIEAGELYIENMHYSLSTYQIIQEREKAVNKWQFQRNISTEKPIDRSAVPDNVLTIFDTFEHFYSKMVPELQNIIIVLLKLLLSTVANPRLSKTETLDNTDNTRNSEIISKAISAIVILLLKWTKLSHALKFEYISQLLVDSGCLLLVLKVLGLHDSTITVAAQTDQAQHGVFCRFNPIDPPALDDTSEEVYTNQRNMFWTINFLRIIQMLTKRKTNRVMLLVQYKSSAILKRMLRISHPMLSLYNLKLLKSQVPYLGRKWRSVNVKIISAIYLRCHTVLRDDWISKTDTDINIEDGMAQEINIRILIRMYHGQRYLPSMLPILDEANTLTFNSHEPISTDHEDYFSNSNSVGDLDPEFVENYEAWLASEVYMNEDEDEEETDTPPTKSYDLGTPIPSPVLNATSSSSAKLSEDIQKLYNEEMHYEFYESDAGAGAGAGASTSKVSQHQDIDHLMQDTVQGSTWYQDAFTMRLQKVEKRTVERWTAMASERDGF
ncbi:hypothetical protein BDF14DRAFT_1843377 [Spinellus fusiger]|nr:hypothetical protein BDF14DRAFT_1843377 [Spinellus fusiger]